MVSGKMKDLSALPLFPVSLKLDPHPSLVHGSSKFVLNWLSSPLRDGIRKVGFISSLKWTVCVCKHSRSHISWAVDQKESIFTSKLICMFIHPLLTTFRNTLCMLKNLNDGVIYKLRSEQVCQNNEGMPQENSAVQLNRQSPNIARGKNRHKHGQQNIVCSKRGHLSSPLELYGGIKPEQTTHTIILYLHRKHIYPTRHESVDWICQLD